MHNGKLVNNAHVHLEETQKNLRQHNEAKHNLREIKKKLETQHDMLLIQNVC